MSGPTSIQISTRHKIVALVGNPNTGKTTLFNVLTGYRQRVGNYPGVTVEKRTGFLRTDAREERIELVDLPGAYSLAAHSADEAVVLDALLGHRERIREPDLIVVVVDASKLARNLFFATQVLEIGRPVVIALNMIDVAQASGARIDATVLERELGVPVIPVIATKQSGIKSLRQAIIASLGSPPPGRHIDFPDSIRSEVEGLTDTIARCTREANRRVSRVEALQILLDSSGYHEHRMVERCGRELANELDQRRQRIEAAGESIAELEARTRYAWIDNLMQCAVTRADAERRSRSEIVDRVVTHRVIGLVILLAMMGVCFQAVYTWAGPVMDAIDGTFGAIGGLLAEIMPTGAVQSLLTDGIVAGVGAVLAFLPQILILFLFVAVLEDCGYMARAALLLDRWMGFVGLSGKSFIPLLCSFACAVPGIMATRTIESRRDRFVTMLIAPLMSCSARLPVYVLLIGAFIPATPLLGGLIGLQAVTLLAFYLVGISTAVPVALILRHTILRGAPKSFLMELPTYKWPSPRTVLYRVYEQGKVFCISAGTIIFAVTVIVWALGYYPQPARIAVHYEAKRAALRHEHDERLAGLTADEDTEGDATAVTQAAERELGERLSAIDRTESGAYLRQSILGRMGHWIEPIVEPLGWDWRIGTAVIASFPAREVVVATMGTIYNLGEKQSETPTGLRQKLRRATWPDGRPVFNIAVALSIMVFFALCCQCGATLAAIKRETNSWRWPAFTFTYMTLLAYFAALITYQVAVRLV